jgi:hypothetical protein
LTHDHGTTQVLTRTIRGCLLTSLPGPAQIGSYPTVTAGTTNYTLSPDTVYDGTVNGTQQANASHIEMKAQCALAPGWAGLYQVAIEALEPFGVDPSEPAFLTSDRSMRGSRHGVADKRRQETGSSVPPSALQSRLRS